MAVRVHDKDSKVVVNKVASASLTELFGTDLGVDSDSEDSLPVTFCDAIVVDADADSATE